MRLPHLENEKGFTLIELLMVIAIFGILMVAIQGLFRAGVDIFSWENDSANRRQQLYIASEHITRAIRNTAPDQIELQDGYLDFYREIVLTSPTGDEIRFYLKKGIIYRWEDGQSRSIATKIAALRFSREDNDNGVFYQVYLKSDKKKGKDLEIKTGVRPRL